MKAEFNIKLPDKQVEKPAACIQKSYNRAELFFQIQKKSREITHPSFVFPEFYRQTHRIIVPSPLLTAFTICNIVPPF
jgi:hypothetical protein